MALRLPESVMISGKPYKVTKNSKKWGGSCWTGGQHIEIGTARNQTAQRKFGSFTHEVLESITLERHLRYEASDDEAVFVMTHKQFDDFAVDVATAFWPMIKKR